MGEVTFDLITDFYPLLDSAFSGDRFSHRGFNLLDNLASLILGELTWHNRLRARGPWIWPGI
jgi:hypothetical protein